MRIESIAAGTVRLLGGHAHAVLEVRATGSAPHDPAGQEAVMTALAGFLNGVDFPVQVLARVSPVDLEGYARRFERAAGGLPPGPLAGLGWEHAAFARRLARGRALLERRCYLAVPAPADALPSRTGAGKGLQVPLPWKRAAISVESGAEGTEPLRRLEARCGDIVRGLARCDIAARRLDDRELAELFYALWCPELARVQRLDPALTPPGALVAAGATWAGGRSGPAPASPTDEGSVR